MRPFGYVAPTRHSILNAIHNPQPNAAPSELGPLREQTLGFRGSASSRDSRFDDPSGLGGHQTTSDVVTDQSSLNLRPACDFYAPTGLEELTVAA